MRADLDAAFAALADPARRRAVELLRDRPRRPSDLADALDIGRPAMSRHLRALREAGLVADAASADDGRERICELRREAFERLRGWIDEVEAFWTEQLAAFKARAERRAAGRRRSPS
jgi:DNA-binding transcriptional ArsR family regulator